MAGTGAQSGQGSGGGQESTAGVDRKIEHKRNVMGKLAGANTPGERARVVLQGVVDAQRAKLARLVTDFTDEINFAEAQISETVSAIEHGLHGK